MNVNILLQISRWISSITINAEEKKERQNIISVKMVFAPWKNIFDHVLLDGQRTDSPWAILPM